jgi:methionine-rich copper-binding protein CopC
MTPPSWPVSPKVEPMIWRLPLLLVVLLAAAPRAALAYPVVVESAPTANAKVAGPDLDITLRFSGRIDHRRSSVTLSRIGALPHDKPAALPLRPTAPDLLKAQVSGLASGGYSLHWQAVSLDGHVTSGNIPFTVDR